jgi:hypothetical protein
MTDKTAFLIGDTHFDGGNLVMVANADGFCAKMVALLALDTNMMLLLMPTVSWPRAFIKAAIARSAKVNKAPP